MSEDLLQCRGLSAGYRSVRVLHDVDLTVPAGSIVAVIGPNGAGKTTLARSLAGFTRIFSGDVYLAGERVTGWTPERRARSGVASVPEGRRLFGALTVADNLELALLARRRELTAGRRQELVAEAFARFPVLGERGAQRVGSLSGGEQQMLAIARALMLEPRLLVLDEPSTGLAPLVISEILTAMRDIAATTRCACLLIEQRALVALEVASYAYVLDRGRLVAADDSDKLLADERLFDRYLGRVEAEPQGGRT